MNVIRGSRNSYGDDMGAFLCYMAVRLIAMRRVLRDDGSIYLHCDPTASHYLKELLDAIFGRKNFRNEIVWCYPPGGRAPKYGFHKKHDILLYYSKGEEPTFHHQYTPLDEKARAKFTKKDEKGRWYKEYRGRNRTYLDEVPGRPVPSWWTDIHSLGQTLSAEAVGYPTQKPLALLERIIQASSNEGDIVLDPFAGCATTCVAAERLKRQWVGIDIWERAHEVVVGRLGAEGFLSGHDLNAVKCLEEPPERTDNGETAAPFLRTKKKLHSLPSPRMTRAEMRAHLLEQHGRQCQGCYRVFDDDRYLELDHIIPRADGGINDVSNRILLCGPCNRAKSNMLTLSGLRKLNKKNGWMAEETT